MNIVDFTSNGESHHLMYMSEVLIYIYTLYMINNIDNINKKLENFLFILYSLIVFSSVIYLNQIATKKELEFNTTMNRILYSIENIEGYEYGKTPVVFIGTLDKGPLSNKKMV
ncbi:MAG: hypothetical protein ACI4WW_01210 [Candidatus Coprovivens sp.]